MQINLNAKQKQTCRHRKQVCCHRGAVREKEPMSGLGLTDTNPTTRVHCRQRVTAIISWQPRMECDMQKHGTTTLYTWVWVLLQSTCQCRRHRLPPWVGNTPWRRKRKPTLVFFPGKSHGQRSLEGHSPWGHNRVRHNLETEQHLNLIQYCKSIILYEKIN